MSSIDTPLSVPKLTETNYSQWAPRMKNVLKAQLVWGIVQGREREPLAEDKKEPFFARQDLATSQIFLNCDSPTQEKIIDIEDPVELWEFLKKTSEKSTLVDEYWLRKRLYSIELVECGSVEAYVETIQETIDEISIRNPDEPIGPGQHCFVLCDGLPTDWLPFIESLHRAGKTSRDPAELIRQFLEHEKLQGQGQGQEQGQAQEQEQEQERRKERGKEREQEPEQGQDNTPASNNGVPSSTDENPDQDDLIPPAKSDPITRSRLETYDIINLQMSFCYSHKELLSSGYQFSPISSIAVMTDKIYELYPELCRRIYVNDRKERVIVGNEQVGDVCIYIRPIKMEAPYNYSSVGTASTAQATSPESGLRLMSRKLLLDWIFETPDWREQLLDNFWWFPSGEGSSLYTLEVEYEEDSRIKLFFNHEVEFESSGITLEMFFPPESDQEL